MSTNATKTPRGWTVTEQQRETCPVTAILRRIGDKWSAVIIRLLAEHDYGFNELDHAIEGISRRMLTRTLRTLEYEGLISRTTHTNPARVEYRLTELGYALREPLATLGQWAISRETSQPDREVPRLPA